MKQNWSPLANLSHVMRHKPALMVFTACVLTIGITSLFTALFISSENVNLPNFDKQREWKVFLKHLSNKELCLRESKSLSENGNVDSISFPSDFLADFNKLGNITNIYGRIDISDFHPSCILGIPKNVDISFSFTKEKSENNMVCLMMHNLPRDFFPNFVETPCTPQGQNKGNTWQLSSNTSGCDSSLLSSLNFDNYANNYEIMEFLTEDDKNSIYLGLTWIGTTSMCIILVVFFYGILYNGRPAMDCDSY